MTQEETPNQTAKAPRYRRQTAEDRRQALLDAALRSIIHHGAQKTSIRTIAQEAGVSVGLINHHFGSKDALIAAAYNQLSIQLLAKITERVEETTGTARERLSAFIRASFSPMVINSYVFQTWLAFWTLQNQSAEVSVVHRERYGAYRRVLEDLIAEAQRDIGGSAMTSPRLCALGLSGLLDGLWVESCLDAETFEFEEGIALAERWIDALLEGRS